MPTRLHVLRRHPKVGALAAASAVVLSACVGAQPTPIESAAAPETPRPTPVVTSDLPDRRAVAAEATIPIDYMPVLFSADDESVWVGGLDGVSRIDPATNEVVQEIAVPGGVIHFATGFDSVWIPEYGAGTVRRYSIETGVLEAEIGGVSTPDGVATTADAVWVANHHAGSVTRIDPASNAVVEEIVVGPTGRSGPRSLLVVDDTVWVSVPNLPGLVGIDATTNEIVAEIPFAWPAIPCGEPGVIGAEIWLSSCADGHVVAAADPQTQTADRLFDVGGEGGPPFEASGLAWLTVVPSDGTAPYLAGVDRDSLQIVDAIDLPNPGLMNTTIAFGSLWVSTESPGTVTRIDLEQITQGS